MRKLRYRAEVTAKAQPGLRLGICVWALAAAFILGSSQAHASAAVGAAGQSLYGVNQEYQLRSLELSVGRHPEIHKRVAVRATGFAEPPLKLWVYADPGGERCPDSPSAHRPRARTVFSSVSVEGEFRVKGRLRMKDLGRHSFCGYLGADDGSEATEYTTSYTTSFEARKVRRPLLQAPRARRTVAGALRRHDFADRVVDSLKRRCGRRSRAMFSCRFSSRFPGYRLTGGGHVLLDRHLSYRFHVRVGELRFALTEDNEGRFPG